MPAQNENLDHTNVGAPAPSAKEQAAARAARIRLGLEKPDPSEAASAPAEEGPVKLPDGVEPVSVEIVNLPSDQLQPLEEAAVGEALEGLAGKLASKDWVVACEGLNTLRVLTVHHQAALQPQLEEAIPLAFANVRNLRSAVQKSALMALQDVVTAYHDAVVAPLSAGKPPNFLQLLQRSAQDKRFVADEAQRLLQLMAEGCAPGLFLEAVLPFAENKSPKVRTEAAKTLKMVVYQMHTKEGNQAVKDACFPRVLKLTGKLLVDAQPGARSAAQELALKLREIHSTCEEGGEGEQTAWEELCKKELGVSGSSKLLKFCAENANKI